jgi:hypothetical protein
MPRKPERIGFGMFFMASVYFDVRRASAAAAVASPFDAAARWRWSPLSRTIAQRRCRKDEAGVVQVVEGQC